MGSAGSKAVPKAPLRRYPTRAAGASPAAQQPQRPPQRPARSPAPSPAATTSQPTTDAQRAQALQPEDAGTSFAKDDAIRADGGDPDGLGFPGAAFSDRLRQMGIVQPHPTFSPSSTAPDDAQLMQQVETLQEQQPQHGRQQQPPRPSSFPARPAANTTLSVLAARRRIQDQAEEEGAFGGGAAGAGASTGRRGSGASAGREFLSARTIKDALVLRARGVDAATIEARLQLKPGVVARLGPPGLVEALNVHDAA
ncbi:hypothetical protein SPI_04928 [Niveomyces insectorum RCEF 264]|uniref:Helix-turn-helix domain-containing protein n=1 Tax=Niveomyces insectorum RCEF 264 TaxID=1081102 RepID=A0A167UZP7_9HYPO|nr:hypothetical protein SPI_04928 [Niveomyces insectorum RCEF 264]